MLVVPTLLVLAAGSAVARYEAQPSQQTLGDELSALELHLASVPEGTTSSY